MKHFLKYLALLIIIFPSLVNAGSITVNKSQVNLNPGKTISFNVSATEAAGQIQISSSNSNIATVDKTNIWVDNNSETITISAKNVGMTSINIHVNGADYDERAIITDYSIVVYVNAVTTTTKITTTTTNKTTTKTTTNKTPTKTTKTTTNKETPTTTTTTIPVEQITEEITTEPIVEKVEEKEIYLNNLKIVGYDLNFKKDKSNYKIEIPESLKELYIITEKDSNLTSTEGLIDIKDKDSFIIEVKDINTKKSKIYKIELIRKKYRRSETAIMMTFLIMVVFIIMMITFIIIIRKKFNKKNKNSEPKDELIYRNDYFE